MSTTPDPNYLPGVIDRIICDLSNGHGSSGRFREWAPLMGETDVSLLHPDLKDRDRIFLNPQSVDSPDVVWPLDVSWVSPANSDFNSNWMAQRWASVDMRDVRGKVCAPTKYMLRRRVIIDLKGAANLECQEWHYCWMGSRWVLGVPRTPRSRDRVTPSHQGYYDVDQQARFAVSFALTQRYEWGAVVRDGATGLAVRFATDPVGARALFKDREKNPETDRKDALRHWVSKHWRKRRDDAEASVFVRQHLRGRTPFTWNGYDCELVPSEFDQDMNEQLAAARARKVLSQ